MEHPDTDPAMATLIAAATPEATVKLLRCLSDLVVANALLAQRQATANERLLRWLQAIERAEAERFGEPDWLASRIAAARAAEHKAMQ